jgi:hypothetical protein
MIHIHHVMPLVRHYKSNQEVWLLRLEMNFEQLVFRGYLEQIDKLSIQLVLHVKRLEDVQLLN